MNVYDTVNKLAEEIASVAGPTLANDITAITCSEYECYETEAKEISYEAIRKNEGQVMISEDFASDLEKNIQYLQNSLTHL